MSRRHSRRSVIDPRRPLRVTPLEDRIAPALMYALNSAGNSLVSFDSATPGVLNAAIPVSGLTVGESIRGIDFRPATGQLYAVAAIGPLARIGAIDVNNGTFTAIGLPFTVSPTAVDFGFDFNPTNDRIRLTNNADENLLINPNDGVVTTQTALNPGDPTIVGSAYANNFGTATTTTLYDIDSASDQLFIQNPPGGGTLQLVGGLGVNTESSLGFDIAGNGTAFASLTVAPATRLYTINLATGAATEVGQIGPVPIVFADIAVARFVWDGGSTVDSNWTTAANWTGDRAPQAGDDLVFPAGAARLTNVNNFPDNTVFNSLTFFGANYIVNESAQGANSIQLGRGVLTNVATGGFVFIPDLTLLNAQTWRNDGAGNALFNSDVNLNGNLLTVNTNLGDVTLGDTSTVSGAGGISKLGSRRLVLQGDGSYTGLTTIAAGTLAAQSQFALGAVGAGNETVVASGATLAIENTFLSSEAIQVSGDGVSGAGAIVADGGNSSVSGPLTLVGNVTLGATAGNTLTIDSSIGETGVSGLTKVGPGTLSFVGSGSNTYTGVTTVNAGSLVLTKINVTAAVIAIPGPLVINGGTVAEGAGDQIADTATVTVNAGGVFDLAGSTDTVLGLTTAGGTVLTNGGRLVTNSATFDNNSILGLLLAGANDSDRIIVNGLVALGGLLQLTAPGPVAPGTMITLIDNDGTDVIAGSFSNAAEGSTFNVGGSTYRITYLGGSGNDVVITALQTDNTPPSVTINQATGQADPTNASPIVFSVVFTEPVTGFTSADVSLAGSTAGGTLVATVSGTGATYTVSVSGMTSNGIVQASIPAGAAVDGAGNASLASTSTDNTVIFAITPPARVNLYAVGAGRTGGPHVKVYNTNGSERFSFLAYDAAFGGGVRVATGDVSGDGVDDIITGAGPTGGPHVKVYDGTNLNLLFSFFPYSASFTGGVFVAAGDVNNDGRADIITGAGEGGGPHVEIFSGQNLSLLNSFFPFQPGFAGGVRVAAGDINGDNRADVVVGSGPGGNLVRAIDVSDGSVLASFFPYANFMGGVYVAAGDVNGDGRADVITGAGEGGGSHVEVFSGTNFSLIASFFAYPGTMGGVRVGAADVNGDGRADIITGAGPGGGPHVKVYNSATQTELNSFFAFDPAFLGGIYVG